MSRIGQYLLLDRIAVGGMAEIYRAKSFGVAGFEKIIAIKRILPALAEDDEFIAMFVEEAKIAGQLSHANIVPIYELGKIGDTHFIAMEYVWGKDVRQIIARFRQMQRRMPPPMAAWIVSRVLEGLDYAHRRRGPDGRPLALIHRDVSPQNVLVSYDGLVKLIDFGIAKAASRAMQTQAGVVKGKLGYMSPEQMMGRPLDHRSDVFAASTCLHEMLTGERLFSGASDIEVIDKVRNAKADPPSARSPEVTEELDRIVLKGLARDPADRYQTAGEMQEELMRFVALSRPAFGTSKLAEWMRTAFAPEIAQEKEHLDRLTAVSAPGESVASASAPAADDDFEGEATVVTAAPSEAERSSVVELSRIVIVEEVERDLADAEPSPSPEPEPEPEPDRGRSSQLHEDPRTGTVEPPHPSPPDRGRSSRLHEDPRTGTVEAPHHAVESSGAHPAPGAGRPQAPAPHPGAQVSPQGPAAPGAAPPPGGPAPSGPAAVPERPSAPSPGLAPPPDALPSGSHRAAMTEEPAKSRVGFWIMLVLVALLGLAVGGGVVWYLRFGGAANVDDVMRALGVS